MLTPYVPYPPASGGQIRTLNLLKYLSRTNEITLIGLYKNDQQKKYISHLTPYCKEVYLCKRADKPWQLHTIFKSIFSLQPFLVVRNFSQEAKTILESLIQKEQFDVIHAETFYIMPHIPSTSIPIFLLEQTIEYKVYQHFVNSLPFFIKPLFSLDILKLKYWERFYWKKAFLVGTVSESDRKIISELEGQMQPVVVPNGAGEEMIVDKLEPKKLDKPVVLFQGNFFWLQNTEAANYLIDKIAPKLRSILPHAIIHIAGQNARNKINTNREEITVVDIDSDDTLAVRKAYENASVFLAPIFGPGGTRLKILAAMAAGLPIVSTKTGVEGLTVQDGVHVLIANTPEEFAQKTKKILSDKKLYETIRKNAYLLVKEKYNWKKIAESLEIAYRKIKKSDDVNH